MLYFSYLLSHISLNHSFLSIFFFLSPFLHILPARCQLTQASFSAAPNTLQNARRGQTCQRDRNTAKMFIFLAEIAISATCNFSNNFQYKCTHSSYSLKLYSKSLTNNFSRANQPHSIFTFLLFNVLYQVSNITSTLIFYV